MDVFNLQLKALWRNSNSHDRFFIVSDDFRMDRSQVLRIGPLATDTADLYGSATILRGCLLWHIFYAKSGVTVLQHRRSITLLSSSWWRAKVEQTKVISSLDGCASMAAILFDAEDSPTRITQQVRILCIIFSRFSTVKPAYYALVS